MDSSNVHSLEVGVIISNKKNSVKYYLFVKLYL